MTPDFDAFWSVYPRRQKRVDAFKAWGQAMKAGFDPAEILAGVERYRTQIARDGTEMRWVALPASYLRGERWTDEDELNLPVVENRIMVGETMAQAQARWAREGRPALRAVT